MILAVGRRRFEAAGTFVWTKCWLVMLLCRFAVSSKRILYNIVVMNQLLFNCLVLGLGLKDLPKKRGFVTFKGTFLSERQTFLLKIQNKPTMGLDCK